MDVWSSTPLLDLLTRELSGPCQPPTSARSSPACRRPGPATYATGTAPCAPPTTPSPPAPTTACPPPNSPAGQLTMDQVAAACHLPVEQIEEWVTALRGPMRQALFYGPPTPREHQP